MKKILVLIAFAFVFFGKMQAQIPAPQFLCVRGDSLFWDLPTVTCGPFVSYDVWASQSPTGPFTLQASVTNASQDYFAFINPSGEQWYFYLTSNYNCPGQTPLTSDTLDNRPPLVSPITQVSVEGGQAVVTWTPSPSPEVIGYVIYRQTSIGVIPVDTVYSGTTYTDPNADPNVGAESYFVNALDFCGNTSIFDVQHTSVFLEVEPLPCKQSVGLNWNAYVGWTNGIAEQQIWVSINGGTLALAGDAGPNATSFEVENVVDGATYCIEVWSVEAVTGAVAKSNQACVVADIVQSVDGMLLENVSVAENGDVEVTWSWNPQAELAEYRILRSDQNAAYDPRTSTQGSFQLSPTNTFADDLNSAHQGKLFYKIEARDVCDTVLTTNYGSTIFLTADPLPGNINQLDWTAFDIENASLDSYTLHKIVAGNDTEVGTVASGTNSFEDEYVPTSIADAQACYYVVANFQLTTSAGEIIQRESRSNTACVEQLARIYAPNAFVPEGINQEFRPLIVLGDIAKYEMKIFDRYGQEVFSTNIPEQGWNGQKGGRNLAQGVYAYIIVVTQESGKVSEKRGTVLLLR